MTDSFYKNFFNDLEKEIQTKFPDGNLKVFKTSENQFELSFGINHLYINYSIILKNNPGVTISIVVDYKKEKDLYDFLHENFHTIENDLSVKLELDDENKLINLNYFIDLNDESNKQIAIDWLSSKTILLIKVVLKLYDANIFFEKGYDLYKLGKFEESIKYYDKALEIDPINLLTLIIKGVSFHQLGKFDEAIKYYSKALEVDSKNATILNNMGSSLHELGKIEESIKFYVKALEINPKNQGTLKNIGASFQSLEKYGEAIKYFDKALELNPKNEDILNLKGVSLNEINKFDEAIKCYDEALNINPKMEKALNNKGKALNRISNYGEAIIYFDKVLEFNPKNEISLANKGNSLHGLNKFDEAIKYYDKALEIDPKNIYTLNDKGLSLYVLGKYEEALKYFDKALEIDSKIETIANNKETTLNKLSNSNKSILNKISKSNKTTNKLSKSNKTTSNKLSKSNKTTETKDKLLKFIPIQKNTIDDSIFSKNNSTLQIYKKQIQELESEYRAKEKLAHDLIKKYFPPPQITFDRFISEIDKHSQTFYNQAISALNLIEDTIYTEKIEEEVKNQLDTLKSLLKKLDDLINELAINSGKLSSHDEVEDVMDDMQDLIDSIKNYDI